MQIIPNINYVPGIIMEAQRIRRAAANQEYLCCSGEYAYSGTWEEVQNSDHFVGENNLAVAISFARMVREYAW